MLSRSHTWLLQAEKLQLFGPSGVSKTHLAIAITMAMMEQDQACRFFPATALVQLLQKAKASDELPALIQKLDSYALPAGDRRHLIPAPERAGDLGAV